VLGSERVRYAESVAELSAALKRELRAGDVFVTLGAGNIGSVAHALHAELGESRVDA
jgi:UDP-N-acetylmuramate-alanine ligase